MGIHAATPIPLSRELDAEALARGVSYDEMHVLGSFWPGTSSSLESRIVKAFKSACPVQDYQPHIGELCRFYSERIASRINAKPDWVIRVLGSSETEQDPTRPQSLLSDLTASKLQAKPAQVFFKSSPRPPMRTVSHLSGPEMLATRIKYATQDLFIRPQNLGGTVLLIDDIMNTGASMRVYAYALKRWAGVEKVVCVNLAVTRFERGKDGWGMAKLDVSEIADRPEFGLVRIDKEKCWHLDLACADRQGAKATEVSFIAERVYKPCPDCVKPPVKKRKWWSLFTLCDKTHI